MKFISKNSNLRIILKPGIPAQPVLGIPATPSVSVKFQDGLAEIKDERILEKMYTHPGFKTDFIAVDENGNDPFEFQRTEIEPAHVLTEIKYGHVEKSMGSSKKTQLTPEMRELVNALVIEGSNKRMKEMLPALLEDTIKKMAQVSSDRQFDKAAEGKIEAVEGDPSLLDKIDTTETPTQKDFEEAEVVELDDVDLAKTLKKTSVFSPIDLPKKTGRPSKK